jgi:hypothetical protein
MRARLRQAAEAAADVRERWHLALQLEWEARNAVRLAAAAAADERGSGGGGSAGGFGGGSAAPPPSAAAAFAAAALRAARGWREALERGADAAAAEAFAARRDAWGARSHVAPPALVHPRA